MAGTKRVVILKPEAIGRWSKGDVVDMPEEIADQYLAAKLVKETDEDLGPAEPQTRGGK